MAVERVLATCAWVGALGVVVCIEVGLFRVLVDGRRAESSFVLASAAVGAVAYSYLRWLAPRLHRADRPRWRLPVGESAPVLPCTVGALVVSLAFAVSDYWPDWAGAVIGAAAFTTVSWWLLDRLAERTGAQ